MKIQKDSIASVTYKVYNASSGALLQETGEQPQEFLFGHNLLLDSFETNLMGLEAGNDFSFEVKAADAYGPIDPHAIFDLPLSTFTEEDGTIDDEVVQVGHVFPMQDNDGNRHYGKIIRKMKESVTMDFNHPMAGKDLLFDGKIHAVRQATEEELQNISS